MMSSMDMRRDRHQAMPGLGDVWIDGKSFHFLDTVDSTNEEAKRLIAAGRLRGCGYVLAREQKAGRGQRGRVWLSPRDAGIYLSVVDRPDAVDVDLSLYTQAAGVACASILREVTDLDVRIRSVNDLYVGHGKVGGILTEAMIERGRLRALITGIGINTRCAPRCLASSAAPPVSLQDVLSPQQFAYLDVAALALRLALSVIHWNAILAGGDRTTLHEEWRRFRVDQAALVGIGDARP